MKTHERFMNRCLTLARKGMRKTAPNPMVGCVIVYQDTIIGTGYHKKFGGEHAEVNAIKSVKDKKKLSHATLYVNLEPCAHFGKTPPCADLIIKHKIPRVVIGSKDPNPKVSGKGIAKLKRAGVEVITGVLQSACEELNHRFFTFHNKQRPYIILKWAESSDGYMAPKGNKQLWLTGEKSKTLVHRWRSEEQAVMVGWKTVKIDEPRLTVRLVKGINPMRVIIDPRLQTPVTSKTMQLHPPVWILNNERQEDTGLMHLYKIDFSKNPLQAIMKFFYSQEIQSVMIEGGPDTLRHFIKAGLWDEARVFTTHHRLLAGKKSPTLHGLLTKEEKVGRDILRYYRSI